MKIRQKLTIGFVGIALLAGVVGYIGYRVSKGICEVYDEIVDETAPTLLALGQIGENVHRIQVEAVSFALMQSEQAPAAVTAESEKELDQLQEAKEEVTRWKGEFAKVAENEQEKEFVEQIEKYEEGLYNAAIALVNSKKEGKSGQVILDLKEKLEEKEEDFLKVIDAAIANEQRQLHHGDELADKLAVSATNLIVAVSAVAFILAVAGGYFLSRTISNPITKLKDAAIELGKGDLNKRAQVKSKDEIGVLAASFNEMADDIQKRNEELQTMNEELRATNEELETSNEELQSTTEELETANEELRQTQEQLIQKEKLAAVGQLASGVGHELRNPLGVIKNAVYYVRTRIGTEDAKLAKHLAIMEREINNSNKIISDLLGFSRTRPPAISPQDINKIVQNALEVVEVPENVLLVKELGAELPKTMADPDQIHQVFVNIALNAIQAMPEGGQLKISTKRKDDFVEIEFSDTGCGIPQENLSKLFDPFFTTKARGIGLGLAVSHGIIERNNGTIEVKSKVGKGTTFFVRLPVEMQKYGIQATDKQKVAVG